MADREAYIEEICALHDCSEGTAKRLPNVVGNVCSYDTWLHNNALRAPLGGLAARPPNHRHGVSAETDACVFSIRRLSIFIYRPQRARLCASTRAIGWLASGKPKI